MARRAKKWLTLVLLVATGAGGWWAYDRFVVGHGGLERVANQVWIERVPSDERDLVHHLLLMNGDRGRIGATGRSSRWRVRADLVRWGVSDTEGRLQLRFQQERKRVSFAARTWPCAGQAPSPFELCLSLERNGRKVMFYSRTDWVVRPREAPGAGLEWLAPAFDAVGRIPAEAPTANDVDAEAAPDFWPFGE